MRPVPAGAPIASIAARASLTGALPSAFCTDGKGSSGRMHDLLARGALRSEQVERRLDRFDRQRGIAGANARDVRGDVRAREARPGPTPLAAAERGRENIVAG